MLSVFHHYKKYLTKELKGGNVYFWLMVSDHGQLAPLLFILWQGRNIMAEETAYLMAARMQKETEKEAEDKI
jgi:hypothetical protein